MPDRIYSEREIAAILARAAEGANRSDASDGPGLTLAEIEHAAKESGLDAALVRQAAADLDAGRLPLTTDRPGTTVEERWADAPFRLDAWEDAVAALRLQMGGAPGDLTHVGESYEWAHTAGLGSRTTVTASPRGDRTRVRVVTVDEVVNARLQALVVTALGSALVGLIAGAVVAEELGMGDLAGIVAVVLTTALLVVVGTPLVERQTYRRRERQAVDAARLADDLAKRFSADAPVPEEPTADDASLLDLSGLGDEPPDSEPTRVSRRARA